LNTFLGLPPNIQLFSKKSRANPVLKASVSPPPNKIYIKAIPFDFPHRLCLNQRRILFLLARKAFRALDTPLPFKTGAFYVFLMNSKTSNNFINGF